MANAGFREEFDAEIHGSGSFQSKEGLEDSLKLGRFSWRPEGELVPFEVNLEEPPPPPLLQK